MKEEKKFVIPTAELLKFTNEDIITSSGEGDMEGTETDYPGGIL